MYNLRFSQKLDQIGGTCFIFLLFFILTTWFTLSSESLKAQGNLLIMPGRAVFEGSKKMVELNLANSGTDTASYTITMVQFRMKEDGSFEEISKPDPGQNFSDQYLRIFPRSINLAPKEAQLVKIQLINTSKLSPGEYRSHMYFRAVPVQKPLGEKDIPADTTTISVKLVPIFGITVPVIIRIGESTAKVNLSDYSFKVVNDSVPRLMLTFNRSGNMSVYGDLTVNYVAPTGKVTQVGLVRGIAVYTPNALRRFEMNLNKLEGVDYRSGKLQITYTAPTDIKGTQLAEVELLLK